MQLSQESWYPQVNLVTLKKCHLEDFLHILKILRSRVSTDCNCADFRNSPIAQFWIDENLLEIQIPQDLFYFKEE